jgi:site-specific DNA-adenine methylase
MNSFLAYMGGKSLLAKRIIETNARSQVYCEVFAGAAWVLFKKEESQVEIINDINTDLVTLYRSLRIIWTNSSVIFGGFSYRERNFSVSRRKTLTR